MLGASWPTSRSICSINNAGQMTGGLLEEQDMAAMYAMFQVNLVAVAHLTARVLPGMLARGHGKIVNNASISGYAHFPAATTYAASKAGVVALTESLRRELRGTGVDTLHLITPGVNTEMLDDTESVYGRYMDTSGWEREEPEVWAEKVVGAIKADARKLEPGGKIGWAVRASRGPGGPPRPGQRADVQPRAAALTSAGGPGRPAAADEAEAM